MDLERAVVNDGADDLLQFEESEASAHAVVASERWQPAFFVRESVSLANLR
ncbi:MAG: hypothetical protein KF906_03235 [Actinobacteria bacterium]|nr:hypothetical protein [Actinomycetota bacterium]